MRGHWNKRYRTHVKRVLNGEAVWGLQLSSLLNLSVLFRRWWLRIQALPFPESLDFQADAEMQSMSCF